MPIDNLSDRVRIPRLGKIRLGIKATTAKGVEYPKAVDYFVCPDEVKAVYGQTPRELDIMFPVEELEQFAPQFLRAYSQTQGLVCIGDGINARRKLDTETGAMANSKTLNWTWHEMPCNSQECPEYSAKKCRRVLNLLFLLPKVSGLGAWQIDSSSYNSIININSMAKMLKGILGRCSMIPLTLVLRPQDVSPSGMKKKTVWVLDIRQDIKLAELAQKAQLPPSKVLLPEVTEEIPEDLYTTSQLGEPEEPEDIPPGEEGTVVLGQSQDDTTEEKAPGKTPVDTSNLPPEDSKHAPSTAPRKSVLAKEAANLAAKTATEKDKITFVEKMRELGYKSKDAIREAIKKATGKEHEWTCTDFQITLALAEQKHKDQSTEEDPDVKAFLNMEDGKLL